MKRCLTDYRHRVTIQRVAGTQDAHGHIDNTAAGNWSTYTSAYASVVSRGGREFWRVHQVEADITHVWYCPYDRTLVAATPEMRLVCEGVTYEIVSVIDIDLAHEEIEIQTKRAVL